MVLKREILDKEGIIISLNALGKIALKKGDLKEAKSLYNESLNYILDFEIKRGIAESF